MANGEQRRKDRVLLAMFYIYSNPGVLGVRIVEDVFRAYRGENSARRYAYAVLHDMERRGLIQRMKGNGYNLKGNI